MDGVQFDVSTYGIEFLKKNNCIVKMYVEKKWTIQSIFFCVYVLTIKSFIKARLIMYFQKHRIYAVG